MRRRDFIKVVAGSAAWPLAARAQPAMPVIGFLNSGTAVPYEPFVNAFREGLKDAGFVDSTSLTRPVTPTNLTSRSSLITPTGRAMSSLMTDARCAATHQ